MPNLLKNLFRGQHPQSRDFNRLILRYNYAFQFASLEATLRDLPAGRAPPSIAFKQRQRRQWRAPTLRSGVLFGTRRRRRTKGTKNAADLDAQLIRNIETELRATNPFAQAYMHLREVYDEALANREEMRRRHNNDGGDANPPLPPLEMPTVALEILTVRGRNNRQYDQPAVQEVAAVYRVHPDTPPTPNIRVPHVNLHENVQPLTFPLLFPRGDTGWPPYIPHAINARSRVTLCEYYAYRLAVRDREQRFRYARKLTQQYIVNAYVDIESNRLGYIRENQDRIRADQYVGLAEYLHRRNLNNDEEERLALGNFHLHND
ncbi:hypothetical protein NQ318_022604 [Aromia moschata]|uniref:Helitron helicase-like domain-containing protein n=1 Tax=Aromia moschata TaxID=1265417 RepID=A0AAV8XDE8_9CUCU|nr:hypothetical protein NQ318_022604 [Aromia moschata]